MEKINEKDVKVIEWVTDCDFMYTANIEGTAWTFYKDTGSGYIETTQTGNIFSLTSGDKIIYTDKQSEYAIRRT